MAQGAPSKDIANSKLRRPLALNESLACTDAPVGDSVLFHTLVGREGVPRWRRQAVALDIDEGGVAAKLQE